MFYVWKMCQHLIAPKITQKCRQMYQFLASSFRIYARPFFAHSVACLSRPQPPLAEGKELGESLTPLLHFRLCCVKIVALIMATEWYMSPFRRARAEGKLGGLANFSTN